MSNFVHLCSLGKETIFNKQIIFNAYNILLDTTMINWFSNDLMLRILFIIYYYKQHYEQHYQSVSSVAQSCPTLCDPMDHSTPGFPVHHQLPEFTQTHVHWVSDAIQPSHPLSSPSPPAPNPSQHQGILKWFSPSHEVVKVLEFQLQHLYIPAVHYLHIHKVAYLCTYQSIHLLSIHSST